MYWHKIYTNAINYIKNTLCKWLHCNEPNPVAMDNLYFILLEKLSSAGVLIKKDITPQLNDFFKNEDRYDDYWNLRSANIEDFLNKMQESGHIIFEKIENKNPHDRPIKDEYKAAITPYGLIFFYEKQQIDSVISANTLSRLNIKLTLFIAILGLIINFVSCYHSSTISKNELNIQSPNITYKLIDTPSRNKVLKKESVRQPMDRQHKIDSK